MRRVWVVLSAVVFLVAACGGGSSADQHQFCDRLGRLASNDPFHTFGDRATNHEIQLAFTALVARSKELASDAPSEVRADAKDYAKAAQALDDLMAAAGYNGDDVDARAYRDQQVTYTAAAAKLQRYLESECGSAEK